MEKVIEKVVSDLISICISCNNHQLNEDSYPSPGFAEYLNRALLISDIPMQSCDVGNRRSLRIDPTIMPWEDSIKNFILDLISVNTKQKFEVCILLTEVGYRYTEATSAIVAQKYIKEGGVVIDVVPSEKDTNIFTLSLRTNGKLQYSWDVERELLVSNICVWYKSSSTLIYCHDSYMDEYRDIISMSPESVWSVSCTLGNYVQAELGEKYCTYVCPVYSCEGSLETRAIGSGNIKFIKDKVPGSYEGKLNYYLKSVRGSRHSSGRCYDCQVLYKTLMSTYRPPMPSPATPRTIKFSDTFLKSISN